MGTLANRQTILVGVDGSVGSRGAARWASDLAARLDAPMLLVYAVGTADYYYYGLAYPDFLDELVTAAEGTLALVGDELKARNPGVPVETKAYTGTAETVLVELSSTARMTVVGAHGHTTLDSALLGSTTLRVANHAHSPVAVWQAGPAPEHGYLLLGVDGSPDCADAVEHAFELASMLDLRLVALHTDTGDEQEGAALLSECLAGQSERYPGVQVEQIVEDDNPAAALLHWSGNARLVVVGSHGRGRAMATMLGSTTQNLLHHVTVPLLICRAGH